MIIFDCENVEMPQLDYQAVKSWIIEVARLHGFTVGRLSYQFCDDETMLSTNRKFLQHDYYTDIITFDYSYGNRISGDMIISLDTVRSNAEKFGEPYQRELLRVVIHGVLHLCGIDDKAPGARQEMERHEQQALELLDPHFI